MVAGPRHLVHAAAAVFCIALALPAIALASGGGKCNASACKVYVEQPTPSPGKQQTKPPTPPTQPTQTGGTSGGHQTHQQRKLAGVLSHAGRDRRPLSDILSASGSSGLRSGSDNVAGPSLLGAALDLGPGPLALLAILLATALGLGAYGMTRNRRGQAAR